MRDMMADTSASPAASPWQTVRETAAMVIGLGALAIICLSWFPLALALYPVLPRRWGHWLGRRVATWSFRGYLRVLELLCGCRFDLRELDALARQGPMIIAANHPSLLDAVLLVSRLPNAVCIMKAALLDNPMFGAAARLAGYIRNDHLLNVILNSRDVLRDGGQIVVFPEGTRTTDFPVGPMLPSIGMVAARTHTPLQTVIIEYSSPYLGKGWPLWRRPSLPLEVRVRLGQRFEPPKNARAFSDELHRHFTQALQADDAAAAEAESDPCPLPRRHTSS